MPRMHVNLQPNTISFDDGENPVVSGIARFGAAMAQLPPQLQHLRMQQAAQDEDKRRFEVTQAMHQQELGLRMNEDTRQGEEHGMRMQAERGKAIHEGYITPHPSNPADLTPDDQGDLENAAEGQAERDAQQQHMKMLMGRDAQSFTPFKGEDGDVLVDHRTGKVTRLAPADSGASAPARPAAAGAAPAAPVVREPPADGGAPVSAAAAGLPLAAARRNPNAHWDGRSMADQQAARHAAAFGPHEQNLHQSVAGLVGPEHADDVMQVLLHGSQEERTSLLRDVPHLRDPLRAYIAAHGQGAAAPVAMGP